MSAPQADGYVRKIARLVSAPWSSKGGTAAADESWDNGNPENAAGGENPTDDEAPAERDDEWN